MPFIQSLFESSFTFTYSLDNSEAKACPLDVYITLVVNLILCMPLEYDSNNLCYLYTSWQE